MLGVRDSLAHSPLPRQASNVPLKYLYIYNSYANNENTPFITEITPYIPDINLRISGQKIVPTRAEYGAPPKIIDGVIDSKLLSSIKRKGKMLRNSLVYFCNDKSMKKVS